jgi:probable rRNA maturation factor
MPEGEISVSFVSEQEIRELNLQYLGIDGPTDVIAFELGGRGTLLGDIYIAPEVARLRAAEWDVTVSEELLRLVVHGVLHVLGHDHPSGDDRLESTMFRLQEEVLRRLDS